MLAPSLSLRSPRHALGSIRLAEPRDAAAIGRLLAAAHLDPRDVASRPPERNLLVLDLSGAVGAVALVVIDQPASTASLRLMIVDATLARDGGHEVEDRMIAVAMALSEAHGCAEVEVLANPGPRRS